MFFAVILPFTTLVHELGHALVTIQLLKVPVEIRLGKTFKGEGLSFGKLTIKIQFMSGWVGFFRYNDADKNANRTRSILILLAGPISSLLLGCTCFVLYSYLELTMIIQYILKAIMNAALAQFLLTIIPIKYPSIFGAYNGLTSDGYKILRLMRTK